ncbi:MAG: translation elongation factor 4 [Patescibacteria group bacterium]
MKQEHIRNFSIIAHIDHGKSTLSDRMLDETHTVEDRKMQDQMLDTMELERERGITIKMQPVRMKYEYEDNEYILNLIDTPGHIDFSYEVSRSLKAVEGAVVLVDATQGIQAQTLTTLEMAQEAGLCIIPALSKTDSPLARIEEVKEELALLVDCELEDIIETSGKTGAGVAQLLDRVVKEVPPPRSTYTQAGDVRALVFDFKYHPNKGIVVFVRMLDGELEKGQDMIFKAVGEKFNAQEVGFFSPEEVPTKVLYPGEIGYIVTGIKKPGIASVGDTIVRSANPLEEFGGYRTPRPVVWASIYPEDQDDFEHLKASLSRLKLSDSSLSYDEETSGSLGRGFRCGFLGMLHLEIVTERLRREFDLALIITQPSIEYHITRTNGAQEIIYNPSLFPDMGEIANIEEPWVELKIITPDDYTGVVSQLLFHHEGQMKSSYTIGDGRIEIVGELPLRELMRGFFDELKSHTSGFASLSYEPLEYRKAEVSRMDILIADEVIPAFARVVSKARAQEEAELVVERLYEVMPRQNFVMKIQAHALGRILSSKTIKAFRKDVTAKLYGGDVTRKRKLLEKQKKGKSKMKAQGKVDIPQNVFMHMMRSK